MVCSDGVLLEQRAHSAAVETAVALRAGRPHGGSLASIEHPELERRQIGRAPHDAAQRIDLASHRALGDATDGGIARHLPDRLERAGDQPDARAESCRGDGRLRAGVSSADHDHVQVELGAERGGTN